MSWDDEIDLEDMDVDGYGHGWDEDIGEEDGFGADDFGMGVFGEEENHANSGVKIGEDWQTLNKGVETMKNSKKTAKKVVVAGVVVLVLGFVLLRVISIANKNKYQAVPTTPQAVPQEPKKAVVIEPDYSETTVPKQETDGWVQFDVDPQIQIAEKSILSDFTVIEVKHLAKPATERGEKLMLKTVLVGNLSGFIGTYELEMPYKTGQLIDSGMTFKVSVEYGDYNDKKFVSGISYKIKE